MPVYLDFEKPLAELEQNTRELAAMRVDSDADLNRGLEQLQEAIAQAKQTFFANLSPIERVGLARHPERPHPIDYVKMLCRDFLELKGDRRFADDRAIFGGFARFNDRPIMVIGTRKGRDIKENLETNFGCAHPEGYRKALRLMALADKARCPIITLIDTPGAYPGIGAEERHISEAIACNLRDMFGFTVPIISIVTGEGGSGGALGLSVANRLLIMANAYFSVITPEGCAAILWRSVDAIARAADALKLTSNDLLRLGIADEVVAEPLEGAHRNHLEAADRLKEAIERHLHELDALSPSELTSQRYEKFRAIGQFIEPAEPAPLTTDVTP